MFLRVSSVALVPHVRGTVTVASREPVGDVTALCTCDDPT